jgi:hypothetical protein
MAAMGILFTAYQFLKLYCDQYAGGSAMNESFFQNKEFTTVTPVVSACFPP